jgi:predicted NAD/FAD-binding protein
VIGSGIGGLTAAWLLRRQAGNEVTLFEQHARPGMGVFGVDYTSRGHTTRIDIPTRVFCERYYPQLFGLLEAIGVRMQATDHAAAFADGDGRVFFHYGNARVFGRSLSYLRPTAGGPMRQLQALRIARDSLRFFATARRDVEHADDGAHLRHVTLGEYLDTKRYSERFVRGVLLPTLSVICTCDVDSVRDYPADLMLGYLTSGVMKQGVMRAELGVETIVSRMVEGLSLVCGAQVLGIAPASNTTRGGYAVLTQQGRSEVFDRIVLATQAHQAASIVEQAAPASAALLRRIPFERSVMRVHTDARVLPRAWSFGLSPVTYHLPKDAPRPEVTVDMTRAFSTYRRQRRVFQTWNPLRDVRDERVLAEATFTRPLVTHDSRRAASELRRAQCEGELAPDLLFCGAYMGDRVPLLEAAVESAVDAATRLGARAPWSETIALAR